MTMVRVGHRSVAGIGRTRCEDVVATDGFGALVVDGIGGTECGLAHLLARIATLRWAERQPGTPLVDSVLQVDRVLSAVQACEGVTCGGACGCFVIWDESENRIEYANVGDTVALMVSGERCRYLNHPARDGQGRLTCYLGSGTCSECTIDHGTIAIDDDSATMLMMSDGAWEYLSRADLLECIGRGADDPQAVADSLVAMAQESGSVDDISVIVLAIQTDKRKGQPCQIR